VLGGSAVLPNPIALIAGAKTLTLEAQRATRRPNNALNLTQVPTAFYLYKYKDLESIIYSQQKESPDEYLHNMVYC